ncbi:ComEA family DNA-binding protein [Nannocystaceae bacterium ST9]
MTDTLRPAARRWLLLAPLALIPALVGLEPPVTRLGRARTCSRAVEVEGLLICDEEIEPALARECPEIESAALRSGDAVVDCEIGRMAAESIERLELAVDVNRASLDELASLPGIGPVLAERIAAGRPYASVEELDRVSGIGPKRLAGLRGRARVE